MQENSSDQLKNAPLFYFKYPMRLEFIPFIELQVTQFIQFGHQLISQHGNTKQLLRILNKKIKDIDKFYHQNWNDYRVSQILTAKKVLFQFCKYHHSHICQQKIKKGHSPNSKTQIKKVQLDAKLNNEFKSKSRETKPRQQNPASKLNNKKYRRQQIAQVTQINDQNYVLRAQKNKPIQTLNLNLPNLIIQSQGVPRTSSSRILISKSSKTPPKKELQSKLKIKLPEEKKKTPKQLKLQNQLQVSQNISKSFLSKSAVVSDYEGNRSHMVSKPTTPRPVQNRKFTKQQYIAYLRSKKNT